MNTVLITGADRGVGYALCEQFLANGYQVFAGQFMEQWPQLSELSQKYPGRLICIALDVGSTESVQAAAGQVAQLCEKLDILVNCAGIACGDGQEALKKTVNVNAVGAIRMTECFLPLLAKGKKRLCYVSSEAGSLSLLHRDGGLSYCASKTVLNMAVKLMFNRLRPEGYTFRLYHPGWVRSYMLGEKSTMGNYEPEETAAVAYEQFTVDKEQENLLIMTDVKGEAWPF